MFGGYTDLNWSGDGGYKMDRNAFLFSLINEKNKPFKMECTEPKYAIYYHNSVGPTFGGGQDLYINDYSNITNVNYSNLGHSFKRPQGFDTHLAGSYKFIVSEIEVFKKM